jgi:predicted translin family RNA/ssDNA-binding protein
MTFWRNSQIQNPKWMITVFLSMILNPIYGSAQTTVKELHEQLSEYHTIVKVQGDRIKRSEIAYKSAMEKSAEVALKFLNNSKTKHNELKEFIHTHQKPIARPYHQHIEKYYVEAQAYIDSLNLELSKENLDELRIKAHATNLNQSISKAEAEHKRLIKIIPN